MAAYVILLNLSVVSVELINELTINLFTEGI